MCDPSPKGFVILSQMNRYFLALQGLGGGTTDLASPNDQDRTVIGIVNDKQGVEFQYLFFRADNDHHAGVGQVGVGRRRQQPTSFPNPDNIKTDDLAQPCLPDRPASQGGIVDRKLCHLEVAKTADDMGLGVTDVNTVGEPFSQALLEGNHVRTPAQFKDVNRVFFLGRCHDGDIRGNLPNVQGDIRVDGVRAVRHDQPGLGSPDFLVGLTTIDLTSNGRNAVLIHARCSRWIGLKHVIGNVLEAELFDETGSNGVVSTDDDVSLGIGRYFARGLEPYLRLQPGSVKEANKGKGQDDEQQDNPGEQHHNAEKPPNIAMESNVAKAQRAHHRQGPVDSSQPGMILPFRVQHDHVEENREEQNNPDQKGGEFEKRANISARCRLIQKIGELRAEQLHGRFQPNKRPGGPSRAGRVGKGTGMTAPFPSRGEGWGEG